MKRWLWNTTALFLRLCTRTSFVRTLIPVRRISYPSWRCWCSSTAGLNPNGIVNNLYLTVNVQNMLSYTACWFISKFSNIQLWHQGLGFAVSLLFPNEVLFLQLQVCGWEHFLEPCLSCRCTSCLASPRQPRFSGNFWALWFAALRPSSSICFISLPACKFLS